MEEVILKARKTVFVSRKPQKEFIEKRFFKLFSKIFFEKKCRIVPKKKQRGTLWSFPNLSKHTKFGLVRNSSPSLETHLNREAKRR